MARDSHAKETAVNRLRALPSIQRLLEQAGPLIAATSHSAVTRVLRDVLDGIRASQTSNAERGELGRTSAV